MGIIPFYRRGNWVSERMSNLPSIQFLTWSDGLCQGFPGSVSCTGPLGSRMSSVFFPAWGNTASPRASGTWVNLGEVILPAGKAPRAFILMKQGRTRSSHGRWKMAVFWGPRLGNPEAEWWFWGCHQGGLQLIRSRDGAHGIRQR